MACDDLITNQDLENAKKDATTMSDFVESDSIEIQSKNGKNIRTLQGINDAADNLISSLGGTDIGDYEDDLTLNSYNEYVVFDRAGATTGPSLWKAIPPRTPTPGTPLPYTIDSATYPDPTSDPNIEPFSDINKAGVEQIAQEEANAGDSQLAGGNIWPLSSQDSLSLGAQSTVVSFYADRFRVNTGSEVELLYLWEGSGTLPAAPFTIENIEANEFYGYNLTVNGDTYEIVNSEIYNDTQDNQLRLGNYGWQDGVDSVDSLISMSHYAKGGSVIDFQGNTLTAQHKGVNDNPWGGSEPNRTCYGFFENLDNLKFINGTLFFPNVDFEFNSIVGIGFAGCKFPVFDNFNITILLTGVPSYAVLGYETFASLITMEHNQDGTLSQGLTIRPGCEFRIYHPDGGNVGTADGNPIHNYSGKLVGIESRGNTTLGDPFIIYDNDIRGVHFNESVGRLIWMWHSKRNTVTGNSFFDCGVDANTQCNYAIRVTHYGSDSKYDDNVIVGGYFGSIGILLSNNNSPRTPENASVSRNKITDSTRCDISVNAGINCKINENQFTRVNASFGHVNFIQQTNSEWKSVEVKGNQGVDVTVSNPLDESTGFIYNSAANSGELDIDGTIVDGVTANGAITQRLSGNIVRNSRIKNASNYGCYHGTGITVNLEYHNNLIEDCPNNWGIGGFADTKGSTFNNTVKRCGMGVRCGNNADSTGDTVEDCTTTHIEVRNGKVKGANIKDGTSTTAGSTAISNTGNASSGMVDNTVDSANGRFGRGIQAPLQTLIANNGLLGTYSVSEIDTIVATVEINNYNDSGLLP